MAAAASPDKADEKRVVTRALAQFAREPKMSGLV
jgi:hypothetical protein